jgi:hypothetical protein
MEKRKKILLLSDDMRMHSGVARQSREIVIGTSHKYDWCQLAGAVKHPEAGKIIKIESDDEFVLPDGSNITLYPTSGYGAPNQLREVLEMEKPDAILHFTDPRFWMWLYEMEHELRQNIPIMYYNIWDDLPDPVYNRNFYRCSDMLMAISKQTYGINKRLLPEYDDWQVKYIPHGINDGHVFPITKKDKAFEDFEGKYNLNRYKFKILYLNRNIRRKQPGDTVLAYKTFLDSLTPEQRNECCIIFHTAAVDEAGTDLKAVCGAIIPDGNVIFTDTKFTDKELNYLYNSCDVYINLASNEGFGLGSAESLMTGTPIIVNVTGGLQDQCGFTKTEWSKAKDGSMSKKVSYLTAEDYAGTWGSNHDGKYQEHGEWVKPVFPATLSLQGSPLTPYIFDDRCRWDEAADAIRYWYDKGHDGRKKAGEIGRQWLKSEDSNMDAKNMSKLMLEGIETTLNNWKPQPGYTMEVI